MRYRAFISYTSADRAASERFVRALARFRTPAPLRGEKYPRGAMPTRIGPLHRDCPSPDADAKLSDATRQVLDASEVLIVLCSPAAARSAHVNEIIRIYRRGGRADEIYPVLVDGAPRRFDAKSAPPGAFPPALFERYDGAGVLITIEATEPDAPDVRVEGDGPQLALMKLISALTGAPLALLSRHQQETDMRQRRGLRRTGLVLGALAGLGAATTVLAWNSAEGERARLESALAAVGAHVGQVADWSEAHALPPEAVRAALEKAETDVAALTGGRSIAAPRLELQRGRLLAQLSEAYGALGEHDKQLSLARDALAALDATLSSASPAAPQTWVTRLPGGAELAEAQLFAVQALSAALAGDDSNGAEIAALNVRGRDLAERADAPLLLAQFETRIGEAALADGDGEAALTALDSAIAALGAISEVNATARDLLARARGNRAEALMTLGRTDEAISAQAATVAALEAAGEEEAAQMRLARAVLRHGDMLAASEDQEAALEELSRAEALFAGLRGRADTSEDARGAFAAGHAKALQSLGAVQLAARQTGAARITFDALLELQRGFVAAAPEDGTAALALARTLESAGDVALAQGRGADAVTLLSEARALRSQIAGDAPAAADSFEIASLWGKIARARRAVGQDQNWSGAYAMAIRTLTPLVQSESPPSLWRRELSSLHFAYGDQLSRADRRAAAIGQWRAALSFIEAELALDSDNEQLNRDAQLLQNRIQAADG